MHLQALHEALGKMQHDQSDEKMLGMASKQKKVDVRGLINLAGLGEPSPNLVSEHPPFLDGLPLCVVNVVWCLMRGVKLERFPRNIKITLTDAAPALKQDVTQSQTLSK